MSIRLSVPAGADSWFENDFLVQRRSSIQRDSLYTGNTQDRTTLSAQTSIFTEKVLTLVARAREPLVHPGGVRCYIALHAVSPSTVLKGGTQLGRYSSTIIPPFRTAKGNHGSGSINISLLRSEPPNNHAPKRLDQLRIFIRVSIRSLDLDTTDCTQQGPILWLEIGRFQQIGSMLSAMSNPFPISDDEVIDVTPPTRTRWRRWVIAAAVLLFIVLSRSLSIYVSALWFGSLGYSAVYWYIFKLKAALFLIFLLLTIGILRGAFWVLERTFASYSFAPRKIMVNNQPVEFSPARFIRPLTWVVAVVFGLFYGFAMKDNWQEFALYFNQIDHNPAGSDLSKATGLLSLFPSGVR